MFEKEQEGVCDGIRGSSVANNRKWGQRENRAPALFPCCSCSASCCHGACFSVAQSNFSRCSANVILAPLALSWPLAFLVLSTYPIFPSIFYSPHLAIFFFVYWHLNLSRLLSAALAHILSQPQPPLSVSSHYWTSLASYTDDLS